MTEYQLSKFLQERYSDILTAIQQHLVITASSILLGILVAVPLGIFLLIFTITNIFQTIPSLALLAILVPLMGIGMKPAIFALFLYSLLPILRNTYAGFSSVGYPCHYGLYY